MYDYETANPDRYGLLKEFARKNRAGMTPCEKVLWEKLRKLSCGIKFRRQHPIADYIADFICLERKLIIEVDGKYHESPEQKAHDEIKNPRPRDLWIYNPTIHKRRRHLPPTNGHQPHKRLRLEQIN